MDICIQRCRLSIEGKDRSRQGRTYSVLRLLLDADFHVFDVPVRVMLSIASVTEVLCCVFAQNASVADFLGTSA